MIDPHVVLVGPGRMEKQTGVHPFARAACGGPQCRSLNRG
jgi:hypothetical protein